MAELYVQYRDCLYTYVLRIVKVPELTEDIVQDTFLKVWELRDSLAEIRNPRAFLFTVAHNHALNMLQQMARVHSARAMLLWYAERYRQDDEVLSRDYLLFVETALQAIPERSRAIFRKCREQTMTYGEVAAEMGITSHAVKKHMMRVIKTLKAAAEKELS